MSIIPTQPLIRHNAYPTWSAEPMPETDLHRDLMVALIEMLQMFYAGRSVYVSGNLLIFYEEGNRRRHVSPDVWLARGVEQYQRPNYLIWEEPRGPEFVIELTSSSTANEDQTTKMALYRDVLRVREYFMFDPNGDYLDPRLQGYRLRGGAYQVIHPRVGRLPSQVTGLHLEADGTMLRLWNPETEAWLPSQAELREQAEEELEQAEERVEELAQLREQDQIEIERLRRELDRLRQQ